MRIFVTDGDNRAALAIVRSLGRAGHSVIVGEKRTPSLANVSRYSQGGTVYPDPASDSDAFVDHLAQELRDRRIDVLIPVADITTFLVTANRQRFAPCRIPFAPYHVIERAANKVDMVQTAMRLGVPVPRTVVVASADRVPDIDLDFPIVVKPWRSRIRTSEGWQSTSVRYARDREELDRLLSSRPGHEFPVLLQERILGPGVGVFACYAAGQPVALFSHRRVRERPPWGGVSVVSESTAVCPQAGEFATRLLHDLGWHGVAMVEFKRDLRDGLPKLMEINGRFWGSLQLAVDAGVDFPSLLLHSMHAGGPPTPPQYRIGVHNRWLWGDVDSLLITLFGRASTRNLSNSGRLRTLVEFMRLWGKDLYYENPKWDDLRPWFLESSRWVRTAAFDATGRIAGQ